MNELAISKTQTFLNTQRQFSLRKTLYSVHNCRVNHFKLATTVLVEDKFFSHQHALDWFDNALYRCVLSRFRFVFSYLKYLALLHGVLYFAPNLTALRL